MGTHPIFESDFDCLTEWPLNLLKKSSLLALSEPHSVDLVALSRTLPLTISRHTLMLLPWLRLVSTLLSSTQFASVTLCRAPAIPLTLLDTALSALASTRPHPV